MIHFSTHSGIHTLLVRQKLPVSLEEAWEFFATPGNLAKITPQHMGFAITSAPEQNKMFPGQIITYKVYPFKGISTNWVTEITHVIDRIYFVDEQRFGPYAMWHHEHRFRKVDEGVEMTDRVTYKLPLGFLGRIMEKNLVRKQLRTIFEYRYRILAEFFGPEKSENGRKQGEAVRGAQ
ncbi:MAG: SRPBCC family protein [Cyclobacteriaceae bacterium]|nr:SRPBCC family protein [Cyclobacteriaceae bacterium]